MFKLEKFLVCSRCFDDPDYGGHPDIECACRFNPRNVQHINIEFLVCECCGSPCGEADTEFNRHQYIKHDLVEEGAFDEPPEDEKYRRTSVREMTKEELIELAKIRISHDMTYGGHEMEKIEYEDFQDLGDDDITVSFIIEPKGYAKAVFYFGLEMFYPDEIKYLKDIGISIV